MTAAKYRVEKRELPAVGRTGFYVDTWDVIGPGVYCACNSEAEANKVCDALNSRPASDWVAVSERMPELGVSVLVSRGRDGCTRMGRITRNDLWEIIGEAVVHRSLFEVTHWMPLPSPPGDKP